MTAAAAQHPRVVSGASPADSLNAGGDGGHGMALVLGR